MTLSKAELAESLDVTIRTVTNWVAAGCPSVQDGGERRFVEAVSSMVCTRLNPVVLVPGGA